MSTVPRPEYPRPQFRRKDWTNLNGEWRFAFDDEDRGRREGWQNVFGGSLRDGSSAFDRTITVPFCYQSRLSGIGETSFHDVVWYARTFDYAVSNDERLLLHFGAVDYRAEVWVNGVHVASHEGGHTPFSADVTHALGGPENVLVVRAEDPSRDVTIPRGKQYWREESEGIFYTRTTGIWQSVWLEPVNRTRINRLRLTPNVDAACVDVEVEIESAEPGTSLRVVVELDGETVLDDAFAVRSALLERRLPLVRRGEAPDESRLSAWTGLALWSPEEPNLYDLRLELLDGAGKILDAAHSYFGMRKVETRDGKVFLNGNPYYQRLVLDQGYFPEGVLTAPTDDDLRRDIELAREMGFNGARKHQKVEDPRWLFWADTLGFLVWGEMANAYQYSPEYVGRMTAEWQEAVMRDYNHPSIVAWVPMNESWGVPNLESDPAQVEHLLALYHLTRSLDGTRPVVSNDGWEHAVTDLCAIHDYRDAKALAKAYSTPESAVAAEPANRSIYVPGHGYGGEPILVTEFGGSPSPGKRGVGLQHRRRRRGVPDPVRGHDRSPPRLRARPGLLLHATHRRRAGGKRPPHLRPETQSRPRPRTRRHGARETKSVTQRPRP
ncbi:glycoside hydrolase family 2 protein [Rubrobacter tropicus]|uniref:glycoside hydrolase family 2 protein n=1 Tax=Rubrobacter tropicus TaxID=2653851 RepID=UPI001A9D68EE|nr:glycoside hydrolase family 2 TIM barrel-domain containing protein [Rubrobacter tropicus]